MSKSTVIAIMCVVCSVMVSCTVSQNTTFKPVEKSVVLLGDTPPTRPFSPGIIAGNMFFCSGMIGRDAETQTYGQSIEEQTAIALDNLKTVIENAGFRMENVVKATVYLTDMDYYTGMNEVYGTYFPENPPARATVGVSELVGEALVEISCMAIK